MKLIILLALYVATFALPSTATDVDAVTLPNGRRITSDDPCGTESFAIFSACGGDPDCSGCRGAIDTLHDCAKINDTDYELYTSLAGYSLFGECKEDFINKIKDESNSDACSENMNIATVFVIVSCADETLNECPQFCQDITTGFTSNCDSDQTFTSIDGTVTQIFFQSLVVLNFLSEPCQEYAETLKYKDGVDVTTTPTNTDSAAPALSIFVTAPVVFIASIFLYNKAR